MWRCRTRNSSPNRKFKNKRDLFWTFILFTCGSFFKDEQTQQIFEGIKATNIALQRRKKCRKFPEIASADTQFLGAHAQLDWKTKQLCSSTTQTHSLLFLRKKAPTICFEKNSPCTGFESQKSKSSMMTNGVKSCRAEKLSQVGHVYAWQLGHIYRQVARSAAQSSRCWRHSNVQRNAPLVFSSSLHGVPFPIIYVSLMLWFVFLQRQVQWHATQNLTCWVSNLNHRSRSRKKFNQNRLGQNCGKKISKYFFRKSGIH